MTGSRQDIVRYRLRRAQETLEDAQILARAERWQPCVNRLYFACFYAVSALPLAVRDHVAFSIPEEVQRAELDFNYLKEWAEKAGVDDLLERAFEEAGIVL